MKANLLSLLTLAILTACAGGSGGGSGGGGGNADVKARWPETGSFSTTLTYNGCTDTYSYGAKADYCVALTDDTLSKCNTLSQREMAYRSDCGDDFARRNVGGFLIGGYDDHLKKQCTSEAKGPFPTINDLCRNIADESIHKGCFWKNRRAKFEDLNCAGEMSPQPTAPVNPAPQPGPGPGPQPQPQPGPLSAYDQMVSDFAAIGIKVEINRIASEPMSPQAIQAFAKTLQNLKPAFAARTSSIVEINLSTYTSYNDSVGHVTLDVNLTQAEVSTYLNLHDQRISLTKSTGVVIDMGVEIFGHETNKTAYMKDAVSFFAAKANDLKAISSLVKTIKIDDSHYLTFFDSSFEVHRSSFKTDFAKDLDTLKKLASIADLGVEFGDYVNMEESRGPVAKFADLLVKNKTAMSQLRDVTKTMKIEIKGTYDSPPAFYNDEIHVGVKSKFDEPAGLNALFSIASLLKDVGAKFHVPSYRLDADFIGAAKLILSRKSQLVAKKTSIEQITFWGSGSDFSYKTLYVGGKDSQATFDKAVAKIP